MSTYDCRECRAGLNQALHVVVGWNCTRHGEQRVDVADILHTVADLREQVAGLQRENAALRAGLLPVPFHERVQQELLHQIERVHQEGPVRSGRSVSGEAAIRDAEVVESELRRRIP
jgi:hypothetical protein